MAGNVIGINQTDINHPDIYTDNYTYNYTYEYTHFDIDKHMELLQSVQFGSLLFIIVVGSVINVWFLAAILSSPEMRLRVRNQIICNSFVLHLVNCAIILPITAIYYFSALAISCVYYMILDHLNLMNELVANWLLVILIAVFIAQVNDFNPATKISPRAASFGLVVLLVFPWIAALVIVPVIVKEYAQDIQDTSLHCYSSSLSSFRVFRSIDTTLPILLAILLVMVAALIRHRRFTPRDSRGSIQAELFGRGPEMDGTLPYVAAVIVSTVCDLLRLILDLSNYWFGSHNWLSMINTIFAAEILSDSRAVLMPLTWLLLPDLRQRIKTWRPWPRPTLGIDLTVSYHKEEI